MYKIQIAGSLLALLSFLLAVGGTNAQENLFLLSKGRAGQIKIGMTLNDVQAKYGRGATKLVADYPEGMFEPTLEIYIAGNTSINSPSIKIKSPSMRIKIDKDNDWVVGGIEINDKRFRTKEGVGLGSTLGEVRKAYEIKQIAFGEGPLVANIEEIEMGLQLDFDHPSKQWYKSRDQRLIPDEARVTGIYLYRTLPARR